MCMCVCVCMGECVYGCFQLLYPFRSTFLFVFLFFSSTLRAFLLRSLGAVLSLLLDASFCFYILEGWNCGSVFRGRRMERPERLEGRNR